MQKLQLKPELLTTTNDKRVFVYQVDLVFAYHSVSVYVTYQNSVT